MFLNDILFSTLREYIFVNGNLSEKILFPRALFYGDGVFETFRYKGTLPVYLDKHFQRLKESAELFDIPYPDEDLLKETIAASVAQTEIQDAYVKLCLVSEGETLFYSKPEKSSVLIVVKKHIETKNEFSLCVSKFKRNQNSPLNTVKSFNYMENILARREVIEKGFDDCVFLNINDEIVETSSSNIFWVRGTSIFTPSLNCGLLSGITRDIVLDIAPELGYEINERKFKLPYLLNSDFTFLTNASAGITFVKKINNQVMPEITDDYLQFKEKLFQKLGW